MSGATFTMESMAAEPGMTLDIPINISNIENIKGVTGEISYDPNELHLDTLQLGDYLDGFLFEWNEVEPGRIQFATSGNRSDVANGIFAQIQFQVLEGFNNETSIYLRNLQLNENEIIDIAAESTIDYVLGISSAGVPLSFALHQNYPNPFNPTTRINYDLAKDENVQVAIFDLSGRKVASLVDEFQNAGYKNIIWNGKNQYGEKVAAGLYMYVIQAGNFHETRKMILLK